MKVTLDLTRLLAQGEITQADYDKLARLSRAETGSLAFNILVALGVVAVGAAALALVPAPTTAIFIGLGLLAAGLTVLMTQPAWLVLANILVLIGALLFGGGILFLYQGLPLAYFVVAAIFAVAGIVAHSGLLTALAVLTLGGTVGAGGEYSHASYGFSLEQPTLTILVFSAIALVTFVASLKIGGEYERLAIIASRTSLFAVNMGFWIGSLWGDPLTWLHRAAATSDKAVISARVFTVVWAVALLAVAVWAARVDRRWVVNLAAVFGAILFYTQWFEYFAATPITLLAAGLITLAVAIGLWKWNNRVSADRPVRV